LQSTLLEVFSTSSALRNLSLKALPSSSLGKSKELCVGSNPKMPTIPKVIIDKLSSKRLPLLKLPAIFFEEKASTIS